MQTAIDRHLAINPEVRFGKPCIADTRIAVNDVVLWHIHLGMPLEQIAVDFKLTLADVHAALVYYYDHREEIDAQIAEDDAFAKGFMKEDPSTLQIKMEARRDG